MISSILQQCSSACFSVIYLDSFNSWHFTVHISQISKVLAETNNIGFCWKFYILFEPQNAYHGQCSNLMPVFSYCVPFYSINNEFQIIVKNFMILQLSYLINKVSCSNKILAASTQCRGLWSVTHFKNIGQQLICRAINYGCLQILNC